MIATDTKIDPSRLNDCFGMKIDFRDEHFLNKYEKAKRTLLRLSSKDELHKIRAVAHHIGWGNYDFVIRKSYLWDIGSGLDFSGFSKISNGFTEIGIFLYQPNQKRFYKGKIEINNDSYKLYVASPYGRLELYAEGEEAMKAASDDARRFNYTHLDVLSVMAWQEYNEFVSTYNRRCFEEEIANWQSKQIRKYRVVYNGFIHPSTWVKINKLAKSGKYYEAKHLIRVSKEYGFVRNASTGENAEASARQLRALGFVA